MQQSSNLASGLLFGIIATDNWGPPCMVSLPEYAQYFVLWTYLFVLAINVG